VSAMIIGRATFTRNSASQYFVGSQTLSAGGPAIMVSSQVISLAPAATAVVVDGHTWIIVAPDSFTAPVSIITFGSLTITTDSASQLVVGLQTLSPGGLAINVGSHVISLAPSAKAITVDGHASDIAAATISVAPAPIITIGSLTITTNNASQYVVGSQTLSAGGPPVTVGGHVVSLAPDASAVVVDGQTSLLSASTPAAVPAPVITIGSSTITRNSASQYIVGFQTLVAAGSAVNTDGTTFSLASPGNALAINSQIRAIAIPDTPLITAAPGISATPISSDAVVIQGFTLTKGSSLV
jgi:hypothetical protein